MATVFAHFKGFARDMACTLAAAQASSSDGQVKDNFKWYVFCACTSHCRVALQIAVIHGDNGLFVE